MRKILLSIVVASTAFAAVPASAQAWRAPTTAHSQAERQIQRDISQMQTRIQRAQQRRTVSNREANMLRRDALQLQRLYNRYSRNGLDRRELASLRNELNRLQHQLRTERRDNDRRRG